MLRVAVALHALAAIILELLVVLSTYHMLARGGREQNPIVVWFMHTLERACAAQIAALSGGTALHPVSDKAASWFGALVTNEDFSLSRAELVWPSLRRLLDETDPSYAT